MTTHQTAAEVAALHGVSKPAGSVNGQPKFALRCPLVESKSGRSVHIWDGGDGYVAVDDKHAGCDNAAVRDALGIRHKGSDGPPPPIRARPKSSPVPPKEPGPLPKGPQYTHFPYHDEEGKTILMVVRVDHADGGKHFNQFTPTPDPNLWMPAGLEGDNPLFRLPNLKREGPVAVFEGEGKVLAAEKAWPTQVVTCWPGGSNSWQKADWEPLRGREVALIADADTPGRKAMRQLAYYLDTELDCTVKVGLPEGETKEDVADWLEQDDAAAVLRRVKELLEDYDPDEADRVEPPAPPPPPMDGDIESNQHYRLLGLAGESVAFFVDGQVMVKTRESIMKADTLYALARSDFLYQLADTEIFGAQAAKRVGDSILRRAIELGQADLTRQTARGAIKLDDGTVVWHLGDRLLVNGEERLLADDGPGAADLGGRIWLTQPRIELGASAPDDDMRKLAAAVMQYRWAEPDDCRRFLGWLVASVAGGALEWRPHLMLAAPATAGKSWLLREVLKPLMGPLMLPIANASSASIARQTGVASLPIMVDEAEVSDPWVLDLFALLRVAAGGEGLRLRANSAGGVDIQEPRFSALLSATSVPALPVADASRLTVVGFGDEVDDWPAVEAGILAAMENFEAIRYRIIRRVPEIVALARAKTKEFQTIGVASRDALVGGALTAGWHTWGLDDKDVHSRHIDAELPAQDAVSFVRHIFALRARPGGGEGDISALEFLADPSRARQAADLFGLTLTNLDVGSCLAIATSHAGLLGQLKFSRWENAELRALLLQIPEAQPRKQLRFNLQRLPAVVIPLSRLAEADIGIDLTAGASQTTLDH